MESENPYKPTHEDALRAAFKSFIPPKYKPKPTPEWATYCPDRKASYGASGPFKIHPTLGNAHNSMSNLQGRSVVLYHLEDVDGELTWVEKERRYGR